MNTKLFTRLRVEALETRNLLSATALPHALLAAAPDRLPPAEYAPIGPHRADREVLQAVRQVAIDISEPTAVEGQLPPSTGQLYDLPQATGQLAEPEREQGVPLSNVAGNPPSLLAVAGLSEVALNPSLPSAVSVASPVLDPVASVTAVEWRIGDVRVKVIEVCVVSTPTIGDAQSALAESFGQTEITSDALREPAPDLQLAGGFAPDFPAMVDNTGMPGVPNPGVSDIEIMQANRGTMAARPAFSRASDPMTTTSQDIEAAPTDSMSLSPARQHTADASAVSDAMRQGELTSPTLGTVLPTPSGSTNSATSLASFEDPAFSSPLDGGFVALDDAFAGTPLPANTAADSRSSRGVDSVAIDQNHWTTDILSGPQNPPGTVVKSSILRGTLAETGSSWSAPQSLTGAVAGDGGGIELAMVDQAPMAGGGSQRPEIPAHNTSPQNSDIRPESDVGLFCDIEVAAAPTFPAGSYNSVEILDSDGVSAVAPVDVQNWKSSAASELQPQLSKGFQPTLAGLAAQLPLIVGVVVFVSRGGLRLEENGRRPERNLSDFPSEKKLI
jgi:hypothetical protein